MKIAIAGKGGCGKTFIAAVIAKWFLLKEYSVLAIDADPAPNLALALGMDPGEAMQIVPVSENEDLIREKTETDFPGVYQLSFRVDDIVSRYAVITPSGVPILIMGTIHVAGSGCMCQANTVVRNLLSHLISERDEVVILDMEAGVEHLGRGTLSRVDLMLVVTDANSRALHITEKIVRLAANSGIKRSDIVGNKIKSPEEERKIRALAELIKVPVVGIIPYDFDIEAAGIADSPVYNLHETRAVKEISEIAEKIHKITDFNQNSRD